MDFQHFGLHEAVVHGVQSMGYSEPTPIQEQSIPVILSGRDLMGSAQTGTGKTAAFALPLLSKLAKHGKTRCLVLEPTRELAAQVEIAFKDYSRFFDVEVGMIHGGVGHGPQKDMLKRGVDVLVATPGRLLDFMEEGDINLSTIQFLVLDEVDRMLDMGFLPQVRRIVERCPKERQTLFFSATLPPEIESLTKWVLKDPATISIGQRRSPAETVTHGVYPVAKDQKFDLLLALLEKTNYHSVIVFTATKMMADRVAARLQELNHPVACMHADRSQKERMEALDGFKSGRFEVLVATDVAARGLDIASVSHVINFDVPGHPEDYVHRIGRTGRAQQEGDAFTLFTAEELDAIRAIERYIETKIPRHKLEGFPYLYTALFNEEAIPQGGAAKGGRTLKGYSFGAKAGKRRR
jgi:ATP-dependent RNA helicase RhlE